jgi:endonuclease I
MKKLVTVCMLALALLSASTPNPGVRHETALSLSAQAEEYYTGDYTYEALSALAGSASARSDEAWTSPLCAALHTLMNETRTGLPSYSKTLSLLADTDASGGSAAPLRFYCDDFGETYNREQVWAESRGLFYHDGAGRDLHHLRAADVEANFIRGTMTFGNVRERFDTWETWPETGEPVFRYREDWNSGAGLVEVRDEVKGDVARILLYVWVTWGDADGGTCNLWTDLPETGAGPEASTGLRVVESLDTLLEWLALDPVDAWELGRNDLVQSLQGSRNVFIDYPELAFLLFDREIPDMITPSGIAHGLHCAVAAVAAPAEGGTVTVDGHTVTAAPKSGWAVERWSLDPADAASVTQSGNVFTLSDLRADCVLTVCFVLTDPCVNGHAWDAGTVTEQPTCEGEGTRTYTCAVCGTVRRERVPALGHDWHTQILEPTCVRPGITVEACWRCGTEIETPFEPALGHAWDGGTVTVEPTKTHPGVRTFRCSRCAATRTEEIPFRFDDVQNEAAWYFTAVYWALNRQPNITAGTGPRTFSPSQHCTRAQIVTFLWRAFGCPEPVETEMPFADVAPDAYYARPVLWAVERGITKGTSSSTFSPNAVCTRAQAVTFLWIAAGRPEPEAALPFADVPPEAYYARAAAWAAARGVAAGTSSTAFSPNDPCTRAQVVTMLWRLLGE